MSCLDIVELHITKEVGRLLGNFAALWQTVNAGDIGTNGNLAEEAAAEEAAAESSDDESEDNDGDEEDDDGKDTVNAALDVRNLLTVAALFP